jgi:hypothetical protein
MVTPLLWRFQTQIFHGARCLLLLAVWLLVAGNAWAQTVTIGSTAVPVVAPVVSSPYYGPLYRFSASSTTVNSRHAYLYTAAELNIPPGSVINLLEWVKADAGGATGNNVFNVWLGNTTNTTLTTSTAWSALTPQATQVYSSTTQQVSGAAGSYFGVATTPGSFTYTGGNLLILTDWELKGSAPNAIEFVANPAAGLGIGTASSVLLTNATTLSASLYGNFRPTLRLTYAATSACTAPPTAGTTLTSSSSICAGNSVNLTLQGTSFGTGLTYQWQQSTDGVTYTDISGATGFTYATPVLTATRYYRARLTCSNQSATSTPAQVTVLQATYATLPLVESFENTWVDRCNTREVPNANWRNTPATGNNSWRREDDGTSAGWTLPTSYGYTPTGSTGTHSARFHSGYTTNGVVGTFDLLVNLSQTGAKQLSFDYVNTSGTDSLTVHVSTDGGSTFGPALLRLGVSGTAATGFTSKAVLLNSTSATTVIRFRGRGDFGSTDIGLDNVRLESALGCLAPVNLTVTGATATTAAISWQGTGTGTYTVFYGAPGFTPGGTGSQQLTGITGTTTTITGLTASTNYEFYVRQNCGSTSSANAGPISFRTDCQTPLYATLPVIESFENTWVDRCDTREVPNANWRNTPATGNNSWRREDDGTSAGWTSPTLYGYTPTGSTGTHSARFHSGYTLSSIVGTFDLFVNLSQAGAKQLSFDYVNTSGTDSLTIHLSTDGGSTFGPALLRLGVSGTTATGFVSRALLLNSTSATTVIRFRGRADYGSTDIGLDNIRLESALGCLTPVNLAVTATTTTTATVAWQGTGTGAYSIQYGPAGFAPGTGTTIPNVTSPYTITGLTPGTQYQFYVQQACSGSQSGLAGPISFNSRIVNDDPCGAIALTLGSDCTAPVQTTNDGATLTTPNGYTNGGTGNCGPSGLTSPRDVWFKFRTNAANRGATEATLTVTGAPAGVMRVFSGSLCSGALVPVTGGCAASASSTSPAPVLTLTGLTPSTDYYVQVSGYLNTTALGNFTICAVAPSTCPVPVGPVASALAATTATLSWSVNSPTPSGTYTIEYGAPGFTVGSTAGTRITGLTGSSTTVTGLTPDTQYCFYVRQECNAASGISAFTGPTCFRTALGPAANDEPCNATVLTVGGAAVTANNIGATTSAATGYQNPGCSTAGAPRDVWFRFVATAATAQVRVTGAPAGQVRLFSAGVCAGPFTALACQASSGPNTAAGALNASGLTVGSTYYVSVSGYASSDFTGTFTIATGTVLSTGTGRLAQGEVNLYPNPSHDGMLNLAIRGAGAVGTVQAILFNSLGQQVFTQAVAVQGGNADKALPVQNLAKGLYTLRLQVGQTIITRKVVLE